MSNFATVSLLGRLTRDPESRVTTTGKTVTKFGLAINRGFGETKRTLFLDVVVWGEKNPATSGRLVKGSLVHVLGELDEQEWQDKEGNKRTKVEVRSMQLTVVSGQSKEGVDGDDKTTEMVDLAKAAKTTKPTTKTANSKKEDDKDEVPF